MKTAILPRSHKDFSSLLLDWNRTQNKREMPWKGERDPYKIWLSEIILQQTRVEQGLHYYNNFIRVFPDVHKLAAAPEEKVFKLWEGLGYYSRCRNLIAAAKHISRELGGVFPSTYNDILSLKGIGPYTAAAISSFAFGLPHAVVDGNVYRVLARVFGISTPIDSTNGKKEFSILAEELLDKKNPGEFNQAIMDFGATVCKPSAPQCDDCVYKKVCRAFGESSVEKLPVKEKKIDVRKRWFNYFIIEHNGYYAIRQRTGKDIWQQLYEFPMLEKKWTTDLRNILDDANKMKWIANGSHPVSISPIFRQQLSHQLIEARFLLIRLKKKPSPENEWTWVSRARFNRFAFPRIIRRCLSNYPLFEFSQ